MSKSIFNFFQFTNRTKQEAPNISNDKILAQLESLFIESVEALQNQNHIFVIDVLKSLIPYDLLLHGMIEKQLAGTLTGQLLLSETTLNHLIELQSHYKLFRINLMIEVVKKLMEGYTKATTVLSLNLEEAMPCYNETKRHHDVYLQEIRMLLGQENATVYQQCMYQECLQLFEELNQLSNASIRIFMTSELKALQA